MCKVIFIIKNSGDNTVFIYCCINPGTLIEWSIIQTQEKEVLISAADKLTLKTQAKGSRYQIMYSMVSFLNYVQSSKSRDME